MESIREIRLRLQQLEVMQESIYQATRKMRALDRVCPCGSGRTFYWAADEVGAELNKSCESCNGATE